MPKLTVDTGCHRTESGRRSATTRDTAPGSNPSLMTRITLALVSMYCAFAAAFTLASDIDFLYRDITFSDPNTALVHAEFLRVVDSDEPDSITRAVTMLADLPAENETHTTRSMLKSNLALVSYIDDQAPNALLLIDEAIRDVSQAQGPFYDQLQPMLMVRGTIQFGLSQSDQAVDSFRYAQHIAHRQDGVWASKQVTAVERLATINHLRGHLIDADREFKMLLTIDEKHYGRDSEELVPRLLQLGQYFSMRAAARLLNNERLSSARRVSIQQEREELFRTSLKMFRRALQIVEATHGKNDLRLIEALQRLAQARVLHGNGRAAERALERVLSIVSSNPSSDAPEIAQAMIQLGDLYTVTSDSRSAEMYEKAWEVLDSPEYHAQQVETFGAPRQIFPNAPKSLRENRPSEATRAGEQLFVMGEYGIDRFGRVDNLRILQTNVSPEQRRHFRAELHSTRFRPRIVEGEAVRTDGLMEYRFIESSIRELNKSANADPAPSS